MPDMVVVGLVALVAALLGFGIALFLRRSFALSSETTACANGDRLLAEARAKQKEILLEAKDEAIKVAKTAETENRDRRAELQRYETRLEKKLDEERDKITALQEEQRTELARVASLTMEEARDLLLKQVEDEMRDLIS